MNPRFEAAWEIHQFFAAHRIAYAIIGGMALPRWGEPRFTKDVDLVVLSSLTEGAEPFARLVYGRYPPRRTEIEPMLLARLYRMVLIQASNGCDIDISLGMPGYEDAVMRRAVDYELEPSKVVRICSAEDLIIHKCTAGRPQDLSDVEGVIIRQRTLLDVPYIRKWLRFFANEKPDPEILERFERAWKAEQRASKKTTKRKR